MDACTCVGLNALIVPWQLSSVRDISWLDVVDTQNWKNDASISFFFLEVMLLLVNWCEHLCCQKLIV